jgi:hypothetical protein
VPRSLSWGVFFGVLAALTLSCGAAGAPRAADPAPGAAIDARLAAILQQPHLVFLKPSGADPTQDVVSVAPLEQGTIVRFESGLRCMRAYFAGGHGICVGRDMNGSGYLFDDRFQMGRTFRQPGLTSRARVSADGRYAASTVFETGQGYSSPGFSTNTLLVNVTTGSSVDLERFTVTNNGQRLDSDLNFWGVTFAADSNRFYATVGTNGHTYLIQGDVAARTAKVLADGVECPSLSPDGTRIAYKHAVPGGQREWRLHVLDLRTMADTALAETRSVDDQAEWLDGSRLLYGLQDQGPPATLDVNLWTVPADGTGTPSVFLAHATSPAVVRG